jgi:hypothetical protein
MSRSSHALCIDLLMWGEEYKWFLVMKLLPPFSKQISNYVLRSLSILQHPDSTGQSRFHCLLFHCWPYKQKLLMWRRTNENSFTISSKHRVSLADNFCITIMKKANTCKAHGVLAWENRPSKPSWWSLHIHRHLFQFKAWKNRHVVHIHCEDFIISVHETTINALHCYNSVFCLHESSNSKPAPASNYSFQRLLSLPLTLRPAKFHTIFGHPPSFTLSAWPVHPVLIVVW